MAPRDLVFDLTLLMSGGAHGRPSQEDTQAAGVNQGGDTVLYCKTQAGRNTNIKVLQGSSVK